MHTTPGSPRKIAVQIVHRFGTKLTPVSKPVRFTVPKAARPPTLLSASLLSAFVLRSKSMTIPQPKAATAMIIYVSINIRSPCFLPPVTSGGSLVRRRQKSQITLPAANNVCCSEQVNFCESVICRFFELFFPKRHERGAWEN